LVFFVYGVLNCASVGLLSYFFSGVVVSLFSLVGYGYFNGVIYKVVLLLVEALNCYIYGYGLVFCLLIGAISGGCD
jgi:general stress protein CsbA